ncbi:MAG: hypothetical protein KAR08_01480 [Candidatus Heimdallarchaeota archaeon]|nr:hypothetical protein [Candidatus Heimdallarchaeota archaeon]
MVHNKRKVTLIADRFIKNELYQMFVLDKALYLYVLLALGILIYNIIKGLVTVHLLMYFGLIAVGTFITIIVQMSRLRNNEHLKRFNVAQIGIIVLNLVIITIPIVMGMIKGSFDFIFVMEQFIVSMWENLTFFLIIPSILMYMFRFARTTSQREGLITFGVITLSSLAFAFAHWTAYTGSLTTIGYLFGIGLLMCGLCYMFSPSLSISVHLLNNLVIMVKMGII